MATLTDEALARRMLERAIANTTNPALDARAVNDLMTMAASTVTNADGSTSTVYTEAKLNGAAATGWDWKAGLTSDQYDLGGGSGVTLTRSQWQETCEKRAERFRTGLSSVLAESKTGRGIGSITLVNSGTVTT